MFVAFCPRAALVAGLVLSLPSPLLAAQSGAVLRPIASVDGKTLYTAYCAQCHGPKGRGDGVRASQLKKPPADLTKIAERAGGTFNQEAVEGYIRGEQRPGGVMKVDPATMKIVVMMPDGPADMPAWKPIFRQFWPDQPERIRFANLAKYLKSIQGK